MPCGTKEEKGRERNHPPRNYQNTTTLLVNEFEDCRFAVAWDDAGPAAFAVSV